MKTITYAAAFAVVLALTACDDSNRNQGATSPNTAPNAAAPQNAGSGPPGGVPPAEIRQLRNNVLTNQ